jgi:hypothetical protein
MSLRRPSVCLALSVTSGLLASMSSASAECSFTPPLTTQTKCVQAVAINGNPLLSYDISWFSTERNEYYLADRSNAGIDIIVRNHQTKKWEWQRVLGGFVGVKLNGAGTAVNNNISGPDGVTSHGRWLYAGDGDSTLKVFDLKAPTASAMKANISTGGSTRVDEMALTADGELLIAANNAEDPPFATLFQANGDQANNRTKILAHITVDPSLIPAGIGLSLEQPAWDPKTKRFYTSIPIVAGNPAGCNADGSAGPITCNGGVLVTDPDAIEDSFHGTVVNVIQGAFNPATRTGVIKFNSTCGPNGASVGPHDNIIFGCTPANNPADVITLVMNATTRAETPILHITGSDEVWFNKGDGRYYTGSNRDCAVPDVPCPLASQQKAVLGVIDAGTNTLIEKVPQSSGSHSVAADARHNFIFVPQNAQTGIGHDTTTVGAGICGTNNGCVAVYQHKKNGDGDDDDDDEVADNH